MGLVRKRELAPTHTQRTHSFAHTHQRVFTVMWVKNDRIHWKTICALLAMLWSNSGNMFAEVKLSSVCFESPNEPNATHQPPGPSYSPSLLPAAPQDFTRIEGTMPKTSGN